MNVILTEEIKEGKRLSREERKAHLLKKTQVINGVECYSVQVFAEIVNRSDQTIRKMILYGNRLNKMGTVKIGRSVFIPKTELTSFKFTLPGTDSRYFVFDEQGTEHMIYEYQDQDIDRVDDGLKVGTIEEVDSYLDADRIEKESIARYEAEKRKGHVAHGTD